MRQWDEARIDALLEALEGDPSDFELEPADRAMLAYAEKLTLDPGGMAESDVERLRAVGFDDRSIHDICAITAYFGFVNRMADGLGVDLEPEHAEAP